MRRLDILCNCSILLAQSSRMPFIYTSARDKTPPLFRRGVNPRRAPVRRATVVESDKGGMEKMKLRLFLIAAAIGGMTSVAFASCNVRDMYTDKQAACAAACEDQFIRDKQKAELDQAAKANGDKKACDAKCGCPENSSNL